jgi:hypothetical protein
MKHVLLVSAAAAIVTGGCSAFPDDPRVDAAPVVAAASPEHRGQEPGALRPVRIACVQDKSGSAVSTRTPQLRRDDLLPIIALLRERGGEVGVGIIHGSLRMRMARIRVDPPPSPPPTLPTGSANPLDEAEQESTRHADQIDYEKRLMDWETELNTRLEVFYAELAGLLKVPGDSRSSPVWSAIARADLFLAESDISWPEPPSRYGVVLSDGDDNTVHVVPALSAEAVWLIVNGDGKVGSLGGLKPKRFESVRAAFAEVVAIERGR